MTAQENELIADTADLAELLGEDEAQENMEATTGSDPDTKIEFYVQMRAWTQRDMEELVIEAAARQLVGRNATDGALAKAVQEAAIRQITARADEKLAAVTADIIDQPVMAGPMSSKAPVTMREMIGLYAKDYLTEKVGADGKFDDFYHGRDRNKARITWIIEKALDAKFKAEIEKATNTAIREIQAAIHAQHTALIEGEKARLREALAKAAQVREAGQ